MLYPQSNRYRWVTNLNGIWRFEAVGDSYSPATPLQGGGLTAVPASMNELVTDPSISNHVGRVVYEREFSIPQLPECEYRLRLGAVSHRCEVFLNGEKLGEGINGYDPVDLQLEKLSEKNRLTVVIDNRLTNHTFPAGRLKKERQIINHDFYNFTGIHRDVLIYTRPKRCIQDVIIQTVVGGNYHRVRAEVHTSCKRLHLTVLDRDGKAVAESDGGELWISEPMLWSPASPYLYTLAVETESDRYEERFGIRRVEVKGDSFLLNGEPIYFKGFGMHEDFFLLGKGNNGAVNIRNFELLKWIHANSIRTSHYPYSEEILSLADEYGILVIDEVPAVGMNWWEENYGENGIDDTTLALHRELIKRLHARDKNHPSVVMVSVANEAATNEAPAKAYFENVMGYARELWALPITVVEFYHAEETLASQFADVICINRYFGWYYDHGDLSVIEEQMKNELCGWHDRYQRPILVTEFGCDTVEGLHALPAESFSEEFQWAYFEACGKAFDACPFCIGEHPWAFADFKTKQGLTRVRGNRKGVFTKDRQPKSGARYLRERWKNIK
ncbi:MAG: beta-glucuronidase [Ruminococcaceae bacterium]|nr:beta-glucuronidase [Oscillospiraceae bacterium]